MVKDSEIGNIAAIGPAGHPPCSKYGRPVSEYVWFRDQAVGDHDGGAVLAEMLNRLLHGFLGFTTVPAGSLSAPESQVPVCGHRNGDGCAGPP